MADENLNNDNPENKNGENPSAGAAPVQENLNNDNPENKNGENPSAGAAPVDEVYLPKGAGEHFKGKDNKEVIDNLFKAYKGARDELANKKGIPESADGYEFDFGEMADKIIRAGDDGKDPVLEAMKSVFHEEQISPASAQNLIMKFYGLMHEFGGNSDGDGGEIVDFEFKDFGGQEKAKPVIDAISMWGQSLGLDEAASEELNILLTHSGGVKLMNAIRSKFGENPIPTDKSGQRREKEITKEQLDSMMKDPRYWRDKDPAYIQEVTEKFQILYADA